MKMCKRNFLLGAVAALLFLSIGPIGEPVQGQGSPRTPLDDHRVVLLGDSQVVGAFGRAMMCELTAHGVVYYTRAGHVGWGVSNWWRQRHNIRRLVRQHRPTLLLMELGGNDFQRSAREDYEEQVERLWDYMNEQMAEIHEGTDVNWRVLWISPASVTSPREDIQPGRDRAAEKIRNVVEDRNYVESRDITGSFGRTPDGLHFTNEGGREWARRLRPRIENCLRR